MIGRELECVTETVTWWFCGGYGWSQWWLQLRLETVELLWWWYVVWVKSDLDLDCN
ncbi:hypothetical protein HanRHA438_Chr05g0226481 [Helianthus annuus]|nr:hypothetical protein HanRHA438_Chr05g0226481 [Helianthus annuus]